MPVFLPPHICWADVLIRVHRELCPPLPHCNERRNQKACIPKWPWCFHERLCFKDILYVAKQINISTYIQSRLEWRWSMSHMYFVFQFQLCRVHKKNSEFHPIMNTKWKATSIFLISREKLPKYEFWVWPTWVLGFRLHLPSNQWGKSPRSHGFQCLTNQVQFKQTATAGMFSMERRIQGLLISVH